MSSGPNEDMTVTHILTALQDALRKVLQQHVWASVFQKNGFGEQFQVRDRLLQSLGWTQAPARSQELPSYEQFAHCFRRGAYIPFSDLLNVVLGPVGEHRARDGRRARPGLLGATAEPLEQSPAAPPASEGTTPRSRGGTRENDSPRTTRGTSRAGDRERQPRTPFRA